MTDEQQPPGAPLPPENIGTPLSMPSAPEPTSGEQDEETRRQVFSAVHIVGAIVIALAGVAIALFTEFGGGDDHAIGAPDNAADAQQNIVDHGVYANMKVTAKCPDDVQDTPQNANFSCTVFDKQGNRATVVSHVGPVDFEIIGNPYAQLKEAEREDRLAKK